MKNLFTSKSIKISSFKMFLAFVFSLVTIFPLHSFSQQPTPTLDGFECHFFNPDGQNALRCGTVITATVDLPDSPILETFTLIIPNTFEVITSNNCNIDIVTFADTINYGTGVNILPGQLVRIQFTPINVTSQCIIKLAYRSCNVYDPFASNAFINTNNLFFNCEGLLPADITIKRPTISANFTLVNGIAAKVTHSTTPAIQVTTLPALTSGYTNTEYFRTFTVKLNSLSIDSFQFSINNENDINPTSLSIINGSNNFNLTSFNYGIGFTNFNVQNLASLNLIPPNRTITFRQGFTLNCNPSDTSIIQARLSCDCSSSTGFFNSSVSSNAILINTAPTYNAFTSDLYPVSNPNSNEFCPNQQYFYDLRILYANSSVSARLMNCTIPLNTAFFSVIGLEVYTNDSNNFATINPSHYSVNNAGSDSSEIVLDVNDIFQQSDPYWIGFDRINIGTGIRARVNAGAKFYIRVKLSANCQQSNNCQDPRIFLSQIPQINNKLRFVYRNSCDNLITPSPSTLQLPLIASPLLPALNPVVNMFSPPAGASITAPLPFQILLAIPSQSPFTISKTNIPLLTCSTSYRLRISAANLPDSISIGNISNLTVNGAAATDTIIDNAIFIDLPPPTGTQYDIEFNLSGLPCPDVNFDSLVASTFGTLLINFLYQAVCESCSSGGNNCVRNLGCSQQGIFIHCPGPCNSDIHTEEDVVVRRNTFGWASEPNYPSNPISNLAAFNAALDIIQTNQNDTIDEMDRTVELSRFYPYDIFHLEMNGERPLQTQLTSGNYTHFQALLTNNDLASLDQNFLSLLDFNLTFTDTSDLLNVISINTTPTFAPPSLQAVPGYLNNRWVRSLEWNYAALGLDSSKFYTISLTANFRVTSTSNNSSPGYYPLDMQLQFALRNNSDTAFSCDPRNREITILVPKVNLIEENNYIDTLALPTDIEVFNSQTHNLQENACKLNSALGINHTGGMGLFPDFNFEYRPLSAWPQNVNEAGIDTVFGFTGSGNTYQHNTSSFSRIPSGNLLPAYKREQIPTNQYKGLVLRLQKECPNSDTLNYPILPINQFAYIHSGFDTITPPPLTLQAPNLNIDTIEINCSNIFNLGIPDTINLANGLNSYEFGINLPPNLQGLPLAIKIRDNAVPVTIDTNLTIAGLSPIYQNGWFKLNNGLDNDTTVANIDILLGGTHGCFPDAFDITFEIKVFCTPQQLTDFVADTTNTSCMGCSVSKTFQLGAGDLDQTNISNTFSTENCDLVWELEIHNPINQPKINLTNLDLNFGSGLIFQHPAEISITCPSAAPQILPFQMDTFNLVVDSMSGAAFVDNTLEIDSIILNSGCTLKYKLRFKLSQGFCQEYNPLNPVIHASLDGENICSSQFDITPIEINNNYQNAIAVLQNTPEICCQNLPVIVTHACKIDSTGEITVINTNPVLPPPVFQMEAYLYNSNDSLLGLDTAIVESFTFDSLEIGTYTLITFNPYNGAFIFQTLAIEDYSFSISLISSLDTVCIGTPIQLTANPDTLYSPSGVPFQFVYSFSLDSTLLLDYQNENVFLDTLLNAGANYYIVTVSNGSCTSTDTIEVFVNPLPIAIITALDTTTFCQGDSVILSSNAAFSYLWSNAETTQEIAATTAGSYSVSITDSSGCVSASSDTIIVTIIPSNTASLDTSNQTLCVNSPLTNIILTTTGAIGISNAGVLGANGLPAGVSATWSSDTITIAGTPTEAGTFNYNIPLIGGCDTVKASGTIIVNTLPLLKTNINGSLPDLFICQPNANIQLGLDSLFINGSNATNYSFLWSPNAYFDIGNTPTDPMPWVSPPSTTTYNLIVTDSNNCSTTANQNVFVNPIISNVVVGSNNSEPPCNNTEIYTSVLGTTLSIYAINNISLFDIQNNYPPGCITVISANSIQVNWQLFNNNFGGNILFDIFDGCTKAQAAIEVNPCCSQYTSYHNATAQSLLDSLGISGSNTISNQTFVLSGNIIIDTDIVFDNCNIAVQANTEIINAGNIFTLYLSYTNIRACDYRWKGINFDKGRIICDNTSISDATNAVQISNLASLEIMSSYLFKNFTDCYIHDIDINNPYFNDCVKIENSTFEGGLNLAPISGLNNSFNLHSLRNILISNVPTDITITIGNDNYDNATNQFSVNNNIVLTGMTSGTPPFPIIATTACIVNRNSNLSVFNSKFKNAYNGIDNKCTGDFSLNIGYYYGLDPSYDYIPKNHFENFMNRAISSSGNSQVFAFNNTIYNCKFGIMVENNQNSGAEIFANDINGDFNTAIKLANSGIANTTSYSHVRIIENKIYYTDNGLFGLDAFGINIAQIQPVLGGNDRAIGLQIYYNNIQNVNRGIETNGYQKVAIDYNRVHVKPELDTSPINCGIILFDCKFGNISNNVVNSTTDFFAIEGIRVDVSQNLNICGNQVAEYNTEYKIGDAFLFLGSSSGGVFNDNHINRCYRGIYLGGHPTPLGQQGSETIASTNTWNQVNPSGYHTAFDENSVTGDNNKIYNPGPPNPWSQFGEYYPSGYIPSPNLGYIIPFTNPVFDFNYCYTYGNVPEEYMQRINIYDDIALDSAQTVGYSNIIKYNSKESLKQTIVLDSALQEQIVLTQFSDSIDLVNMGKIIQTKNLFHPNMNASDSLLFVNELNSISSGVLLPEILNKEVLNQLATNLALKDSVYSNATLSRLRQIAKYCPYTKGSAVYLARKILSSINPTDVFYCNSCEVPSTSNNGARTMPLDPEDVIEFSKIYRQKQIVKAKEFTIKPNPNNGSFYIETTDQDISNLELWSIEGKFIQTIIYQKGIEINLVNIEKGIYIIKASNKKGELFISKLIKQ